MASRSRLLHLPFRDPDGGDGDSDSAAAHVLLRVSPASSLPLDVELLATQGTEAFVATCKLVVRSFVRFAGNLQRPRPRFLTFLRPIAVSPAAGPVNPPCIWPACRGQLDLTRPSPSPSLSPQPCPPGTETFVSSHLALCFGLPWYYGVVANFGNLFILP